MNEAIIEARISMAKSNMSTMRGLGPRLSAQDVMAILWSTSSQSNSPPQGANLNEVIHASSAGVDWILRRGKNKRKRSCRVSSAFRGAPWYEVVDVHDLINVRSFAVTENLNQARA